MRDKKSDWGGHFVLAAWCTATKQWQDLPHKYESIGAAQDAAIERGIYRVAYLQDGRRLEMEPFALIGDRPPAHG